MNWFYLFIICSPEPCGPWWRSSTLCSFFSLKMLLVLFEIIKSVAFTASLSLVIHLGSHYVLKFEYLKLRLNVKLFKSSASVFLTVCCWVFYILSISSLGPTRLWLTVFHIQLDIIFFPRTSILDCIWSVIPFGNGPHFISVMLELPLQPLCYRKLGLHADTSCTWVLVGVVIRHWSTLSTHTHVNKVNYLNFRVTHHTPGKPWGHEDTTLNSLSCLQTNHNFWSRSYVNISLFWIYSYMHIQCSDISADLSYHGIEANRMVDRRTGERKAKSKIY